MSDSPEQDEALEGEPGEQVVTETVEHVPTHVDERHEMPPRPAVPNRNPHKSSTQIANEVWAGQWGGENWQHRVESAGYNVDLVERLVEKGVGRKSESDVSPPIRTEYDPKH